MVALARSLTTELHILLVELSRSVGLPYLAPAADAAEAAEAGVRSQSQSGSSTDLDRSTETSEADKKGWARSRTTDLLVIVLRGLSYIVHHTPGQQQQQQQPPQPPQPPLTKSQQGGAAKPGAPKQPPHRKRAHGVAEAQQAAASTTATSAAAAAAQQAHGHRGNRWVCALVLDFIAETTDAASYLAQRSEPTDPTDDPTDPIESTDMLSEGEGEDRGDLGSGGSSSGKLAPTPKSSEQLLCGLLPR